MNVLDALESLELSAVREAVPEFEPVFQRELRLWEIGDALAAEFIECLWDNPAAVALMGPKTRERAARLAVLFNAPRVGAESEAETDGRA